MRAKNSLAVVATAAPVVIQTIRRYWPLVKETLESNPQLAQSVQKQVGRLAVRRSGLSLTSVGERIGLLRDQVGYLALSSDSDGEARTAEYCRSRLDAFDASLRVIATANPKLRKKELRRVSKELDTLTDKIVSAFIVETAEDGGDLSSPPEVTRTRKRRGAPTPGSGEGL